MKYLKFVKICNSFSLIYAISNITINIYSIKLVDVSPNVNCQFNLTHKDYLINKDYGVRQLITWLFSLVMEEEALVQSCGQSYKESIHAKLVGTVINSRPPDQVWRTRIVKPQFCEFPFKTQVFEKYSRVEKAILNGMKESYLQGFLK